ncbi:IclR family transcriptional regulator [Prauserella muralis]|uniref:Uncharacterized protein n=1 Tax=Prauserella muralis TaxID=588067 RepID=A0A2V4ADE3_9PSEU|nr:IclR family transcriptional regulator [Prauserella muralis]PXY16530.1 hypothetical protein BAY60_35600 [Prauserella muralis]TWE11230.1 IclR family transcriptional regulator [Prauserella muralis]
MSRGEVAQTAKAYQVPAIERSMLILQALQQHGPLGLADLVSETGLSRSTCYYLVRTMAKAQLVESDEETRKYHLGIGLVELGSAATEQLGYLGVIKRYIFDLLEEMDATFVIYRRLDRGRVAIVDKVEPSHRLRVTVPLGTTLPIQGGSFGRCFLAYDHPTAVREILNAGLQRYTEQSITDVDRFLSEINGVRERGWALDREGFALGVSTVAAPMLRDGQPLLVVGAVAMAATLADDATVERWGRRLREICDSASTALHRHPRGSSGLDGGVALDER